MVDHLSWIEHDEQERTAAIPINEVFLDEHLFALQTTKAPWYASFVNYLASNILPPDISYQQKKKLFSDVNNIFGRILSYTNIAQIKSFGGMYRKKRWRAFFGIAILLKLVATLV